MADLGIRFILAALAVWRITHLLSSEDSPFDLLATLRWSLGQHWLGKLLDCPYCLSMWVAAPFTFFVCEPAIERVVVWLALSGAACLLERTGTQPVVFAPADIHPKEEVNS